MARCATRQSVERGAWRCLYAPKPGDEPGRAAASRPDVGLADAPGRIASTLPDTGCCHPGSGRSRVTLAPQVQPRRPRGARPIFIGAIASEGSQRLRVMWSKSGGFALGGRGCWGWPMEDPCNLDGDCPIGPPFPFPGREDR